MTKEITVKLTLNQARAAWRLLSNIDGGCDDDAFLRSCETGCRRITKAIQDAGERL